MIFQRDASVIRLTFDKMKTVAVVGMIFIHCLLFYSFYFEIPPLIINLTTINKLLISLSLFPLCIPAIAGAELRYRIRDYIKEGNLVQFPYRTFAKILLIVALLDPIKTALASGFVYALRWDALPLISISVYFILNFLSLNGSIKKLAFVVLPFIFILEPFLKKLFKYFAILSDQEAFSLRQSSSFHIPYIIEVFVFSYLIWQLVHYFLLSLVGQKKVRYISFFLILVFVVGFSKNWMSSPLYAAEIWNLPFGMLLGIEGVKGHMWPILPWSSLVVVGFLFQHLLDENFKIKVLNVKLATWIFLFAFVGFIFFLVFYFPFYYQLLSSKNYFSYRVFHGGSLLLVMVNCFYICFHYLTYVLSQFWKQKLSIFKFFGGGILIMYVIHFILAARLAPILAQLTSGQFNFWSFFALILSLTLALSGLFIYLYQSKIVVVFKR